MRWNRGDGGKLDTYVMNADGSGQTRLTGLMRIFNLTRRLLYPPPLVVIANFTLFADCYHEPAQRSSMIHKRKPELMHHNNTGAKFALLTRQELPYLSDGLLQLTDTRNQSSIT